MVTEQTVESLSLTDTIVDLFQNSYMIVGAKNSGVTVSSPAIFVKANEQVSDEEDHLLVNITRYKGGKPVQEQAQIAISAVPVAKIVNGSLFIKSKLFGELKIGFMPGPLVDLEKLNHPPSKA